ncbi:MAG: winged helix-turn-helix transcriptional regulator [Proteobacteria bacterium]|nr:winged helix-turn-helix transcriptional regulator [Pseudomonadota bacterium]
MSMSKGLAFDVPGSHAGAVARRRRNTVLEAIERFRRLDRELTVTSLLAFLYICENEGLSVSDVADLCGLGRTTASRACRALGEPAYGLSLPPSLGLVTFHENPHDGRGKLLFLTERGRVLEAEIDAAIARAVPIAAGETRAAGPIPAQVSA